jgi:hypothetical protein
MKMSVFTGTDFVFETKSDKISYPKGAFIQLEVDKNNDVYVVNHRFATIQELSDPKDPQSKKVDKQIVETKFCKFARMEDLKFASDNLFFEDQLSEAIDLKDLSLSDILLKERISPDLVTCYLSNKSTSLEKSYVKEGITRIRLPVRTIVKDSTLSEKLKMLSNFDKINPPICDNINVVTIREKNRAQETRHIVATESLYKEVDSKLLGYLQNKLTEACPKDWKIRTVEGAVRVSINGERPAALSTILETLPIKVTKKLDRKHEDTFYEVRLQESEEEKVVESFYTRYTPYDLAEDISDKKEGDPCQGEGGKQGILYKLGDSFVCMVEESYLNDLDLDEVFFEGDSCGPNGNGKLKIIEGKMCCVVDSTTYTQHFSDFKTFSENSKEGDKCSFNGKDGRVRKLGESLVCEIKETSEEILFTCLGEDGGIVPLSGKEPPGDPPAAPAGPKENDPCDDHGHPGVLKMINGALICSVGGGLPAGAGGAN